MVMTMSKGKKYTKPVAPRPSIFEYEPYIKRIEREMNNMDKFLEDMRENRVAVNPSLYGCETATDVYNKIVDSRNQRAVILRNWVRWVKLSAPVLEADDKDRPIENLESPESYWYEADLTDLNETSYVKRLTITSGKWKEILDLRGHLLVGDPLQARILRKLYITVMESYLYAHGFATIDKDFYVMPHQNWREKMGAIFTVNNDMKVHILK